MAALAIMAATTSISEAADQASQPWSTCLTSFELRRAFDGGKDEAQPANVSLVDIEDDLPDGGSDPGSAYLVDLAVRNKRCSIKQTSSGEVSIGGSGEWHLGQANALQEEKRRNRAKAALSLFLSQTVFEREDQKGNETFSARLWVVLKAERAKDFIDETWIGSFSATALPSVITRWAHSFFPGESLTVGDVTLAYYPSVGIEYHRKARIGEIAPPYEGWDWLIRVEGLASIGVSGRGAIDGPLQISGEFSQRWRLEGLDTIAPGDLTMTTLSATFWVDQKRHIGVGYAFDNGRAPVTNFIAQRRSSIGLQLKF